MPAAKAVYFKILEYTPDNLGRLQQAFDLTVLGTPSELSDSILAQTEVMFAPLGYRFDAELMKRCPRLRALATNTTGVPHIDVEYAENHGIRVISLKDEQEFLSSITPTAELTIGLMICITRNVMPAYKAVLNGNWRRWDFGGPAMLSRMTLGIVGLGRLGKMVARYASAIGMKIIYYDPHVIETGLPAACERVESLEQLVSNCDITTIHVPMSAANRHLFNADLFAAFRRGAFLVNTARGEIVDSLALTDALRSGHLAGAAVDVLDNEFEPGFENRVQDHPLVKYALEYDNLIITPHIAGSTKDAWHLTQRHTIEQAINAVVED